MMLEKLLKYVTSNNFSDLHISAGNRVFVRHDGDLQMIPDLEIFSADEVKKLAYSMMNQAQKDRYDRDLELDFSLKFNDGSRFRVNLFHNINGPAISMRLVPSKPMTLEDIGAPQSFFNLCGLSKGLVLVTGQTGAGKSSTLAAMVGHINNNYSRHIITIEDPIEFVHQSKKSLINQREIGHDSHSFPNALRSALREDPDVIMVGEVRDLETVRQVLTAAETGHLVLATLHTASAAQSINRIIDIFPSEDKLLVRSMLSSSLQAIISQRLVSKIGGGRCAAFEVLIANSSVRNLIREDQIPQINSMIEIGSKYGMLTMKDSLKNLVADNQISQKEADELIASFGQSVV